MLERRRVRRSAALKQSRRHDFEDEATFAVSVRRAPAPRRRCAWCIAILITIAGAIALTRIPVSQFPDIVPPQVQVAVGSAIAPAARRVP